MTDAHLAAIRAQNDADKAVQSAVVFPDRQIVRMAGTVDELLREIVRLRSCTGSTKRVHMRHFAGQQQPRCRVYRTSTLRRLLLTDDTTDVTCAACINGLERDSVWS